LRPRVDVREGRHGRELRVGGQLASVQGRGAALTGPVWYALAAPLLALPPARRRSVLILGLGAGSAARVVRGLAPRARIVGVEVDGAVVAAARRHFGLDALEVEVALQDARLFLERERRRFDAVIEDLFVGSTRAIRKPEGWPEPCLRLAAQRVASGGVLAVNTIHEGPRVARALRALGRGGSLTAIEVKGYYNRVMTLGPAEADARALRRRLEAEPLFRSARRRLGLRCMD
jgi:spermidine synthase